MASVGSPHVMGSVRRWSALAALVVALFLAGAGPAAAHDVLVGSDPADGATLSAVPAQVSFTFDQPVQNFDPEVAITGPDGVSHTSTGVSVLGNVVSAPFGQTIAGSYIAAYRIISADGHPVTGEIRFTVAAGASAAPTSAGEATPSTPTTTRGSSALPVWAWIALGAAALIVVVAVLLILRRPARDPQ